jgi:hypothetical protein
MPNKTAARPELPPLPRKDVRDFEGDFVARSDESILRWGHEVRRKVLEEVAARFEYEQFNTSAKLVRSMLDRKEST